MSSRTKFGVLLVSSVIVLYSVVGGMMGRVSAQDGAYPQLSMFMEVIQRIQNDYVDEPSLTTALEGAIRGMVEQVDPNGGYLSPDSVEFYEDYDPFAKPGVGVVLGRRFDFPVIITVVPGSPADLEGLTTGDAIEGIGGESLREHNLVEVRQLLTGEPGTTVDLNVIRRSAPAPETVTLTRTMLEVPAVESEVIEAGVGYVHVPVIAPGKVEEVREAIESLRAGGATSLVLDLRATAGGGEGEGFGLADLFLESGTLGYLEGQTVQRETFSAEAGTPFADMDLAVLIDEGTAGAAEIAAGAIRDNERAPVIGARSFGLASIQRLLPLDGGYGLLISVANFYTPNGDDIHAEGVEPTEEVARNVVVLDPLAVTVDEQDPDADLQLERAIEVLTGAVEEPAAA